MEVYVSRLADSNYLSEAPFHPSESFPEMPFDETSREPNSVYAAVREVFRLSGWDADHFGLPAWNPLSRLIRPGETVVLKPNLITERHPRLRDGWICMLTHGSVIRAVADYVIKALDGRGTIIVADAPQTDSSFKAMVDLLQLSSLKNYFTSKGIDFRLVDIRQFEWESRNDVVVKRRRLEGDPNGYVKVDLGRDSLLYRHSGEGRYYGADYDTQVINEHHSGDRHEYLISGSAIKCDVFINLPKMKTHKKTGVTLSLKNLVGINGDKNFLPHYSEGTPDTGGDQFPADSVKRRVEATGMRRLRRMAVATPIIGQLVYRGLKKVSEPIFGRTSEVIRGGNWHGNDTCWRMCLDLNRALLYANTDGSLRPGSPSDRKRYLTLIDGIIAGDGNGPIDVDPVGAGLLVMSTDPVAADACAATLMGFDPRKLPVIHEAFGLSALAISTGKLDEIIVVSNVEGWNGRLSEVPFNGVPRFRPHFGWRGHIEFSPMIDNDLARTPE